MAGGDVRARRGAGAGAERSRRRVRDGHRGDRGHRAGRGTRHGAVPARRAERRAGQRSPGPPPLPGFGNRGLLVPAARRCAGFCRGCGGRAGPGGELRAVPVVPGGISAPGTASRPPPGAYRGCERRPGQRRGCRRVVCWTGRCARSRRAQQSVFFPCVSGDRRANAEGCQLRGCPGASSCPAACSAQ